MAFYGGGFFRCIAYFLIMLQGAIMGKKADEMKFEKVHIGLFVLSVGLFYALFYIGNDNALILLSFCALFGVTRYGYLVCCSPVLKRAYDSRTVGALVYIISQLCLEVYLIQKFIFTKDLNTIFPLNIPIIMLTILLAAYIVKSFAELIAQTFKTEPYEWEKMLLKRQ